MKEFSIPVTWQVWDKVTVQAETIEQALQYLEDNMEDTSTFWAMKKVSMVSL